MPLTRRKYNVVYAILAQQHLTAVSKSVFGPQKLSFMLQYWTGYKSVMLFLLPEDEIR